MNNLPDENLSEGVKYWATKFSKVRNEIFEAAMEQCLDYIKQKMYTLAKTKADIGPFYFTFEELISKCTCQVSDINGSVGITMQDFKINILDDLIDTLRDCNVYVIEKRIHLYKNCPCETFPDDSKSKYPTSECAECIEIKIK